MFKTLSAILFTGLLISTASCQSGETRSAPGTTHDMSFIWSSLVPSQAYDAASPQRIKGWTHRRIDTNNNTAYEHVTQCYPGGIMFRFEKHFSDNGIWVRDADGGRYGGRILFFEGDYQGFANGIKNNSLFLNTFTAAPTDPFVRETERQTFTFTDIRPYANSYFSGRAEILPKGATASTVRQTLSYTQDNGPITKPDWATDAPEGKPAALSNIQDNIWVIENLGDGRNVLAVLGQDGWAVFGAPLSGGISEQIESLLQKEVDRPVTRIFVSHAHGDHTGGLNYFIKKGAEVIISGEVKSQIEALNPDILIGINVATFSGRKTLTAGNTDIDIWETPNSHAKGLSFVHIPSAKLIYQGDFLHIPRDGTISSAAQITREFVDFLTIESLTYERIVGHHEHSRITPGMMTKLLANTRKLPDQIPSCDDIDVK